MGGSFATNVGSAAIPALDGSYLCGEFQSGRKNAPGGFGGMTFPLTGKFSIDAKLQYNDLSTSFDILATPTLNTPLARAPDGSYVTITRRRAYLANLSLAGISGLLSYSLVPQLCLSAGPFVGFLIRHSYQETEYIVSPSDAVYAENNLPVRTIDAGSLPNSLQYGIELNASYELPFQPNIGLRPSLGMMIPFTTISAGSLRSYPISASLELVYHLSEPAAMELPREPEMPIAVATASSPKLPIAAAPRHEMLQVSIHALGVSDDGREVSEPVLIIERTHVTEVYPMLHYVFFGDGSSTIPERYHLESAQTRGSFNEKNLYTDNALEIHHHVLDIIGKRLSENPEASITLVGARSEHSPGDSAQAPTIAMDRARTIQNYLATVWGISRDRIHLRARALPEAASDDHNPFGEAENRRVEIIPSTPDITAPLWTEHIERVATPPRIDFVPSITTAEKVGIRSATITVLQHGHLLRTIDALSDSAVSEYRWTIDDRSMPEASDGPSDSLTYRFTAVDSLNDTARASGVIHLWQKASDRTKHASDTELDKQIERYSLILFDYSSSQLDKTESERIVSDMASEIRGQTQVTLTGHTDQTGDDSFNDQLSRDRAMQAAQMLKLEITQLGKPEPSIAVEWRGSRDELFDNSIPEGRVLSRTVRAIIENPTK
ncbi:MAG TPA: OmpA family protein [Candidatus Kapabacteria bacterium]|nr:OmpA family protein [Candidatus Kapabacteria bacterium]